MTRVPIPIKTPDHRIVGYLTDLDQFESQPFSHKVHLPKIIQTGLNQLNQWLSHSPHEPRIQLRDKGQLAPQCWQVFDPISQRTLTFETETDVRNWLEQRYYQ